ncbi:acyltransferase [Pantoea rodasii]|uniref:Acyltransferase n=1 Tax=Pantoea rodasii TaxID=1076549 RepID=A0A2M9W738_9GAMM|nr:acyltransferase [Pantoea rodasii]ORM65428.1 acyltransferase [Pantoea rodasii]PJZ03329.1 acyltransferase [Pantoea rodasii]
MHARIKHLDGMRGLAILLVIGYHAYARWPELLPFANITQHIPIFSYGWLGVELFFMISGFVIFMTLDKSESYISFLKKRWLRLFPAMLIASLLLYFVGGFFPEWSAMTPYVRNLLPGLIFTNPETLTQITGIEFKSMAGSFWSLYVEAVFYLIIGAIYFSLGRKYCLPGLLVPMLLLSASSVLKSLGHPVFIDVISKFGFIHYAWFMVGCLVYERMHGRDKALHYAIVAFAMLINFSYYVKNAGVMTVIPLLIVMLFFIASFYSKQMERLLSLRFFTAIGFASYAFYLIHENLMIALLIKLNVTIKSEWMMLFMPIVVATVLYYLAWFITKYLEPALRNVLKGKRAPAAEAG